MVDVQIVGGDATNYHVQMSGAVYSLPRAHVVSSVALQPAVMYTPPPAPEAAGTKRNKRLGGIVNFCLWYGVTAMIATVRVDDDRSARLGYVPVLGPLLWSVPNDEDGFLEDGWDWLAVLDTTMQGISAWWILTGGEDRAPRKVTLTPVTRRNFHGIALGGSF